MRGIVLAAWLMVPVAVGAYHYGPGQQRLELDQTQDLLAAARQSADAGDYGTAVKLYSEALAALPDDRVTEAQRIRLERAKAQMLVRQLPAAYDEVVTLVPQLQDAPSTDPKLLTDARTAEANAKYYLTWLMRLEGQPRAEWEPEIEGSRQLYRLLAEQARDDGDERTALARQEDLEAAIRLARLDLSELQALPLPSQCQGCCSSNCQCKGKCKGTKKSMAKKEGKDDARGASSGPPPDNAGN
ncbi:MAG: hypothetical protein HYX69_03495 [Planctomycetia bacterium]|nr:hypothetical protein [Planctomycetia bacterium]